jgi:hypothetical protein
MFGVITRCEVGVRGVRGEREVGGGIDSRAWQRWALITGVAHHDDRDLFLVDRAQHRGGSYGQHPRPQPDRVVHLRHHLFAFAQRLRLELLARWCPHPLPSLC